MLVFFSMEYSVSFFFRYKLQEMFLQLSILKKMCRLVFFHVRTARDPSRCSSCATFISKRITENVRTHANIVKGNSNDAEFKWIKVNCWFFFSSFFTKYDLQKHEVTHFGNKSFQCTVCDKAFHRITLLRRHEKVIFRIVLKSFKMADWFFHLSCFEYDLCFVL